MRMSLPPNNITAPIEEENEVGDEDEDEDEDEGEDEGEDEEAEDPAERCRAANKALKREKW